MISALTAIYHARIDYPGFNPPPLATAILPPPEVDSEERGIAYKEVADIPINKAGDVEDEALLGKSVKR